jgi:hypothetical protein
MFKEEKKNIIEYGLGHKLGIGWRHLEEEILSISIILN